MSIQAVPDCECAGFNSECFGVYLNVDQNSLNPNDYLQFPVGQGVETLPALIDTGDMEVGNNILMTGIEGVNYIQFPDDTEQFTAYVPSGGLVSTSTFTSATTGVGINDYFSQANIISYPNGVSKYSVSAFGGAGQMNDSQRNPIVPVDGQPFSSIAYGTPASGNGIKIEGIPISTANQVGNTEYAVQLVVQPNIRVPNINTDGNDRWAGTFSFTKTISGAFITITSTITGLTSSIVAGTSFWVNNPPFGCPTSFVCLNIQTAGSVYNVIVGDGANNPSYYFNQTGLTGYAQPIGFTAATIVATVLGNTLTVDSTTRGFIAQGKNHWIYLTASNAVFFKPFTSTIQTSYTIVGNASLDAYTSQTAYVFLASYGTDTYLSTWQGNWQPAAILRGSGVSINVGSGVAGSITVQQPVGTSTTQIPATNGSIGYAQSTQTYPTGLVNFTNTVVSNSLALQSALNAIQTCANSGAYSLLYPPSTFSASSYSVGGFGGVEVKFYA